MEASKRELGVPNPTPNAIVLTYRLQTLMNTLDLQVVDDS
jgi:hypothetical protein